MKRLVLVPDGWPCKLRECPPGLFVTDMETVCVKSQYPRVEILASGGSAYWTEAYIADNGDAFGGCQDAKLREEIQVQPVKAVWEEVEE